MLSKLLPTAAQGSSRAKSGRSGDFAMVSEGYDGVDGPWNLSNAVQVSEPKNLIWTRVRINEVVSFDGKIQCSCRRESGVVYRPALPSLRPSRSERRTASVIPSGRAMRARVSAWHRFAAGLAALLIW